MKYPKIKFVKRANMWCVTYWDEKNEQQQKWFSTYEEAYDEYSEKLSSIQLKQTSF